MRERILVVDDDTAIRRTFKQHLTEQGYSVATAESAEEALTLLSDVDPALIIADIRMPGMDGIELLRHVRSGTDGVDVLVMTAHEDMETAVTAMKAGAYDYLVKPLDLDEIDRIVGRCLAEKSLRRRVGQFSSAEVREHELGQIVGRDPAMIEIYKLIGILSENRATVLIRGETGTGKERIAKAIHFNSQQADEPFVAVNCTALTESLLESELFGHVRGAFTGAIQGRKGYFELAGAGTVFLDEIGDMSRELQSKLLRVLEEREFYPVGSERPRLTEARVIAATHCPLEDLVRDGSFREDLYFRLRVVEIVVPPLRERKGDVGPLAEHLLARIGDKLHRQIDRISEEAMEMLQSYKWPGNVRELDNTLTRAAVLARGPVIGAEHISLGALSAADKRSSSGTTGANAAASAPDALATVEADHVRRILERTGGNKRQAARLLAISRQRLDRLIEKHELRPESGPPGSDS
jgi:two-component system response regulator AtoC